MDKNEIGLFQRDYDKWLGGLSDQEAGVHLTGLIKHLAETLLTQLDEIKPRHRNAIAFDLLVAAAQRGARVPDELLNVFRRLLETDIPSFNKPYPQNIPAKDQEAWSRAVKFEATHPRKDGAPSTASLEVSTKAAFPDSHGIDEGRPSGNRSDRRQTVRSWREAEKYCFDVETKTCLPFDRFSSYLLLICYSPKYLLNIFNSLS